MGIEFKVALCLLLIVLAAVIILWLVRPDDPAAAARQAGVLGDEQPRQAPSLLGRRP